MSRFHITAIASITIAGIAFSAAWHAVALTSLTVLATAIGLGVAVPKIRFFGPFICSSKTDEKVIALTFDDGPDPRSTPALLDLLKEENVESAFFCIGRNVAASPDIAARITEDGHVIANHTFHHSNATNWFTEARLLDELTKTQDAIKKATGSAPTCFRPPMGLSNPRVFRAARKAGLKVIGWTVRSLDTRLTDPEVIVRRIMKRIRPGGIVLMHDGNISADRLIQTVRLLLNELRARGYLIIRLDKLLS